MEKRKLKIFSFFSGSGFLDLGFELNGFDIEFVNEFQPAFMEAYKYSRSKMGLRKPTYGYYMWICIHIGLLTMKMIFSFVCINV